MTASAVTRSHAVRGEIVPRSVRVERFWHARHEKIIIDLRPRGQNLRRKRKRGMPATGVQSAQSKQKYTFTFQFSRRVKSGISTGAMMQERSCVTVIERSI